jgi:D-alanyl-D-alanine carboxypeptidase/D-alanyl-D-alanine-endopeptidase (penicillin-binding protein 4)
MVFASGVVAPAHAATEATAAKTSSTGDLNADLDQILSDSRLAGATVGLIVRNATTGEILYTHNVDTQVIPASNNKIETSTAAFGLLGAGYRFRTSVYTRGGDLYIKGTGDPTMRAADYDARHAVPQTQQQPDRRDPGQVDRTRSRRAGHLGRRAVRHLRLPQGHRH